MRDEICVDVRQRGHLRTKCCECVGNEIFVDLGGGH